MLMKKFFTGAATAALMATASVSAHADFVDLNIAGWKTFATFADPANTFQFLSIGAGATVTGYDYTNLSFTTSNGSFQSEFVLSVNSSDGSEFLDWAPSETDDSGTFGPASGSFGGATGFGAGAPFVATDGVIFVTAYELFDDPGLDATVNSGTLRIFYTPVAVPAVPEPETYALMAFGLLALGAFARRRQR